MKSNIDISRTVQSKYITVNAKLANLSELIESNQSDFSIKKEFKDFKNWIGSEFKQYSKDIYANTYFEQWYFPLLEDIFVQSLIAAQTNSPIKKIQEAVIDAIDYFNYWNSQLPKVKEE